HEQVLLSTNAVYGVLAHFMKAVVQTFHRSVQENIALFKRPIVYFACSASGLCWG
ncbi:hypothetical protein J6590_071254, partial [Homalodisca vitripennis]